jgi:hypothetical protein
MYRGSPTSRDQSFGSFTIPLASSVFTLWALPRRVN